MLNEQGTSGRLEITPSMVRLQGCPTTMAIHCDERFCCGICTDPVVDPVVTRCGHLYCWPCLYQWLEPGMSLEERALFCCELLPQGTEIVPDVNNRTCPLCKTPCSIQQIVPIYVAYEETGTPNRVSLDENGQFYIETDDDLTLSDSSSQSFDSIESQSTGSSSVPHRPSPPSLVVQSKNALSASTVHGEGQTTPYSLSVPYKSCSLSNAMISLIEILTTPLWLDRHNSSFTPAAASHVACPSFSKTFSTILVEWGQRYNSDSDKPLRFYLFAVAVLSLAIIVCVDPS